MFDPLAMDKRPYNFLTRQRETDERVGNGASFSITQAAGDERYIQRFGGATADRPDDPFLYMMFFDTDLGLPIWYDGTNWVDATGATV